MAFFRSQVADFGTSRLLEKNTNGGGSNSICDPVDDNEEDEEEFVAVYLDGVRAWMSTLTSPLLQTKQFYLTTQV